MEGLKVSPASVQQSTPTPSNPQQYIIGAEDTVRAARCGCVPGLNLLYEDVQNPDKSLGNSGAPSWAKKIPLFGPLWCVSGAQGTTKVRRR